MKRERHREDPVDVTALGPKMMSAVIPMGIGAAVGAGVMLGLRLAGLRWTWALIGVLLVWPVWQVGWQSGLAFATAVGVACFAGFFWERMDIERGGTEAQTARERLGPGRCLWTAVKRKRSRGEPARGDWLAVGVARRGVIRRLPFGRSRGVHAIVPGATGSGKTVTLAAIAQAYVLAGLPAIVVDPKGDGFLRRVLVEAAGSVDAGFIEWSPFGSTVYNPFDRGGPTEITDKALAGHRWTEPHYELMTQRLLGQVLRTMREAGRWPPTLSAVVELMDPERLDDLASDVGGGVGERVSAYVDGLSTRAKAELGGGRDRLAVLAESELGPRLDPALGNGLPRLSFEDSLRRGDVVYMQIDADRYPAASKLLGAAVVIDLVTLTAGLQQGALRGLLVIDEFSAVAAQEISRLFGRARTAGLSVLLGTQSLADLRAARPDDPSDTLTEQVLSNVEFALVHRQSDPDSAERLARLGGTTPEWATTRRISGLPGLAYTRADEGTRTREREFLVHPDDLKRLPPGEAALMHPTGKPPAEIIRVWPPRELP